MHHNAKRRPLGDGVRDQLPGRIMDAYNTEVARRQYLSARFGLSNNRAMLIGALAFGEGGQHA